MTDFESTQFSRIVLQMIADDETMSRREKRQARMVVFFRPRIMREIENAAFRALKEEETIPQRALGDGNFDWDKFLDFLKELFQLILSLIAGLG